MVTMGLRSVPFLLFLPPLPLAAEAATLAICFPLLSTAFFISTPFIILQPGGPGTRRGREGRWEVVRRYLLGRGQTPRVVRLEDRERQREERGEGSEASTASSDRMKNRRGAVGSG